MEVCSFFNSTSVFDLYSSLTSLDVRVTVILCKTMRKNRKSISYIHLKVVLLY